MAAVASLKKETEKHKTSAGEDVEKWEPRALLVGMQMAQPLGSSMEGPQTIKNTAAMRPSCSTSGLSRLTHHCPQQRNVAATQVSTTDRRAKHAPSTQWTIPQLKTEGTDTCYNVDGPGTLCSVKQAGHKDEHCLPPLARGPHCRQTTEPSQSGGAVGQWGQCIRVGR